VEQRRELRLAPEGLRGVYLNELSRPHAERCAAAFADLLWERQPLIGRGPPSPATVRRRHGPAVVVGHDARPSSPDLVTGVAAALRRMGCQVIDVGLVSRPCLWFAVDHLQAAGGICVTGSGCGPSWNGLEFIEAGSLPWSHGGMLDCIVERLNEGVRRSSRTGGLQRTFQARPAYAAGLRRHFHALRPLRVAITCAAPNVRPVLDGLFVELPCLLHWCESSAADDGARADELAVARLATAVRESQCHFGMVIADDGQRCHVLDERGQSLAIELLTVRVAELLQEDHAQFAVALESGLATVAGGLQAAGCHVHACAGSNEAVSRAMRTAGAVLGAQTDGRFWFRESYPACDAVLTLAKMLQLLSRSDRPASALRSHQ
jgi:phosphomannomutase